MMTASDPIRRPVFCACLALMLFAGRGAAQAAGPPAPAERDTSRLAAFLGDVVKPMTWAVPLGYTVYDQIRDEPDDWDQDWGGLGQRFASNMGRTAVSLSLRHGVAALLHAPADPVPCPTATGNARLIEAALEPVADRNCSGTVHIALPRITARVGAAFAPLAWNQPDFTSGDAAWAIVSGFVTASLFNVAEVLVLKR